MSSQEEYLDNLLKDLMNEESALADFPEGISGSLSAVDQSGRAFDLKDTAGMTAEDIDRILARNTRTEETTETVQAMSLDQLLEQAEEADAADIRDMLQKSDRNEPVSEEIISLLENAHQDNFEIDWDDKEEADSKAVELSSWKDRLDEKRRVRKAAKEEAKRRKREEKEQKAKEKALKKEQEKAQKKEKKKQQRQNQSRQKVSESDTAIRTRKADEYEELPDVDEYQDEIADLFAAMETPGEHAQGQDTEPLTEGALTAEPETADLTEMGIAFADPKDELSMIREKGDPLIREKGESVAQRHEEQLIDLFAGVDDEEETEKNSGKKKKGFFGKLFDLLTQEDEEDGDEKGELILSDENEAILEEFNKDNKKKKKSGKRKKKAENDEETAENQDGKTGKKEKKPRKEQKVKRKEPEEPGKKLSKHRSFLILLICLTWAAVLLILVNVIVDFADKKKAATLFYKGDYEGCYQNLCGKSLNESQRVMFGKSESILRIRLWMREYELLAEEDQRAEALDSLLQSVYQYPSLYAYSHRWNAAPEVEEIYNRMLDILLKEYGLTEEMAKFIADEKSDLRYSQMVRAIAGGKTFEDWEDEEKDPQSQEDGLGTPGVEEPQGGKTDEGENPGELKDPLPEEEDW